MASENSSDGLLGPRLHSRSTERTRGEKGRNAQVAVGFAAGARDRGSRRGPAHAAFPYLPGSNPGDYGQYRLRASDPRPGELTSGAKQSWMYAADQEPGNEPVNSDPRELYGVRGAHVVDRPPDDDRLGTTTGRPDVTIAVLDSGIKWNDRGAMRDLRRKMRLNKGELPTPNHERLARSSRRELRELRERRTTQTATASSTCVDYACDSRVDAEPTPRPRRARRTCSTRRTC